MWVRDHPEASIKKLDGMNTGTLEGEKTSSQKHPTLQMESQLQIK